MIVITAPTFCAAVILIRGRVVRTAPILNYMIGWHSRRVRSYAALRGWKVDE